MGRTEERGERVQLPPVCCGSSLEVPTLLLLSCSGSSPLMPSSGGKIYI